MPEGMGYGKEYYGMGYNDFANMPDKVVHKKFPEGLEGLNADLNDTMFGIDTVLSKNANYLKGHRPPDKY